MSEEDSALVNINTVRLDQNRRSLENQRNIDPQSLKAIDRIRLSQKKLSEKIFSHQSPSVPFNIGI